MVGSHGPHDVKVFAQVLEVFLSHLRPTGGVGEVEFQDRAGPLILFQEIVQGDGVFRSFAWEAPGRVEDSLVWSEVRRSDTRDAMLKMMTKAKHGPPPHLLRGHLLLLIEVE